MITSFMKLILLLIFMSAAHVFRALAAGDSVKDAQLRGWSDQLATCHTITSRDTLLGTQGKQTDTPFITD